MESLSIKLSIRNLKTLFPLLFLFSQPAQSFDQSFDLVGKGVFSYLFWDVYQVEYFKGEKNNQKVRITYLRDISKERNQEGWVKALKQNLNDSQFKQYKNQIDWLVNNSFATPKGTVFEIIKKDSKIEMVIASPTGLIKRSADDPKLNQIILMPWIGDKPIDEDLKNQLLGAKKKS